MERVEACAVEAILLACFEIGAEGTSRMVRVEAEAAAAQSVWAPGPDRTPYQCLGMGWDLDRDPGQGLGQPEGPPSRPVSGQDVEEPDEGGSHRAVQRESKLRTSRIRLRRHQMR